MKKLLSIIMVTLLALVFAGFAQAEDRLSLSGAYHLHGYHVDKDADSDEDFDVDDENWWAQRMRVKGTVQAADGIKLVIRADISDSTWGDTAGTTPFVQRPGADNGTWRNAIDFDLVYAEVDQEMWQLTVGQQFYGLGILELYEALNTGIKLRLKFEPATLSLFYAKIDENDSYNDDDDFDDTDFYSANVDFQIMDWNTKVFGAMRDNGASDDKPWGAGIYTNGAIGMVGLIAELDFLGGDNGESGAAKVDYTGLQFYLRGDFKLNDMVALGADLLYAQGTDDDDEQQLTSLGNLDDFAVDTDNTPAYAWIDALNWSPFDFTEQSAGSVGGTIFVKATPMEKLSVGAKLGYLTTEEDKASDAEVTFANAWIEYALAANTSVSLTYLYSDLDYDSDADGQDVKGNQAMLRFAVSF